MRRAIRCVAGCGLALAVAGAATAETPAHPALAGLTQCAATADASARAACYDAALADLNQAVRKGEVVIVRKAEAQAAQRSAFGLNLPALGIFDRASPEAAPLERVAGEVKTARRDEYGRWIVQLADGAVWRQTDNEPLAPPPRPGSRVEIRRGGLGSFFMKIDNHRGVRARRSD